MTGVDVVLACLLGVLPCDMQALAPPQNVEGPQIITICPEAMEHDGRIIYSHVLPDVANPKIVVVLSCGVDG